MLHINSAVKIRAPLNAILANKKSVEISVQNRGENEMKRQQLLRKKIIKKGNLLFRKNDGKRRCWRLEVRGWMFVVGRLMFVTAIPPLAGKSRKFEVGSYMLMISGFQYLVSRIQHPVSNSSHLKESRNFLPP